VKYIVAPNKLHSLYLEDWAKAFPEAKLYAPPELKAKHPNISFIRSWLISRNRSGRKQ